MTPDRQRALARCAKLQALARDQRGTPEGATAQRLFDDAVVRWAFTPAELAAGAGAGASAPHAFVSLGGDPGERYREQYRAVLLAALADLAHPQCAVTFSSVYWIGYVYAPNLQIAQEVAAVYTELQPILDREFKRWWIPRRFGFRPKASMARWWWVTFLRSLTALSPGGLPEGGLEEGGTMLQVLDPVSSGRSDRDAERAAYGSWQRVPEALVARIRGLRRWRTST